MLQEIWSRFRREPIKMRFLHNKKGVELSLQTVIVAVIVLIVLIVLIVIFLRGTGGFLSGSTGCAERGGTCMSDAQACIQSRGSVFGMGRCSEGMVCCLPEKDLLNTNEDEFI